MASRPGKQPDRGKSAADRWKRVTVVASVAKLTGGSTPDDAKSPDSPTKDVSPTRESRAPLEDEHFKALSKKFSERVKSGNRASKLEGELRNFVKDIQASLRLEEVTRDEHRDRELVHNVRRAAEATIYRCFQEHGKEQLELDKLQTEYFTLQQQNREMQKKRVVENIGLKDKIRKPDANESYMSTEEAAAIPELNTIPDNARELCEIAINERVRQILERPNKVLLDAINDFLENEDMPEAWSAKVPDPPPHPASPRSIAALMRPGRDRPPAPLKGGLNTAERKKITDLQEQIKKLEAELLQARNETKSINEEKEKLTRELEALRQESQENLEGLREQLKAARGSMHEQILLLEQQLAAEKASDNKEQKELNKLLKEKARLQKEVHEIEAEDRGHKKECERLDEQIPKLQAELDSMQAKATSRRASVHEMRTEQDGMKQKIIELTQGIEDTETTIKELLQMQKDGLRFNEHGEVYSIAKPKPPPKEARKRSTLPDAEAFILPTYEDVPGKPRRESQIKRDEAAHKVAIKKEKKARKQAKLLHKLIKVLESQGRLSTPDGNKSRDWGASFKRNTQIGPVGKTIVQLLSEAESEGILDSDGEDRSETPNSLNARNNVPAAMKGRKLSVSHGQHFVPRGGFYVLSPEPEDPSEDQLQETMRLSQSCTDFGVQKRNGSMRDPMGLTW